jgi:hypothetical protein
MRPKRNRSGMQRFNAVCTNSGHWAGEKVRAAGEDKNFA